MHNTTLKEIAHGLDQIDLGSEPVVFLHSNLFAFGLIEKGMVGLYALLMEWLGSDATLLMPAFSYHNDPNKPWECNRTGAKTGVLTEYFRKQQHVFRSIHPIHSVSAYGKHAQYFTSDIDKSSFGEKSPFAKLYLRNAHNISLGTEFEGGATYLHYVEELLNVPYRTFVKIPVAVFDANDTLVDKEFAYFARISTSQHEYVNEWNHVWTDLNAANAFTTIKIGPAKIIHSRMRDTGILLTERIKENPYYCASRIEK